MLQAINKTYGQGNLDLLSNTRRCTSSNSCTSEREWQMNMEMYHVVYPKQNCKI